MGLLLCDKKLLITFLGKHHVLGLVVPDDVEITLGDEIINRGDPASFDFLGRYGIHVGILLVLD